MADEFDKFKISSAPATTSDAIAPNPQGDQFDQYKTGGMPNLRDVPTTSTMAGRMGAEALPAIGATAGSLALGPEAAIPGAMLGSSIKGMLKNKFPNVFGEDESKDNPIQAATDIGKDTLLQGALPEIAGMGASRIGTKILASKFGQAFPSVEKATEAASETALKAGQDAKEAGFMKLPDAGEGNAVRRVLTVAKSDSGKFNPEKIMTELNTPTNKVLISPGMNKNVQDFAEGLNQVKSQPEGTYLIRHVKNKLILGGLTASMGLATGHAAATTAAAGGLYLTDHVLGKLMANPDTAALVVKAMKTPTGAPEADFIQKALMSAARGSLAGSKTADK